jgi:NADPH-dependent 2,4-dienoyl-CoA reductase/sulfur reductase-like enzyme
MTEMFRTRQIPVSLLVREKGYWGRVLPYEESKLINKHIREHHVDLHLETELEEILGDGNGNVKGVKTKAGKVIPCEFVGLAIGVVPNIEFVKSSGIETDKGILVNEYLETNVPDVYAAGDCAQHQKPLPYRKPVEQVWYTARMMGEVLAETICGNKTKYCPGIGFNSAKFFDIEYQNYGWVFPDMSEHHNTFYWEHKSGRKALRFVYDKNDKSVFGINTFGMRLRHEVCEQWIKHKIPIDKAIKDLKKARFDPEYYHHYEQEINHAFIQHQNITA